MLQLAAIKRLECFSQLPFWVYKNLLKESPRTSTQSTCPPLAAPTLPPPSHTRAHARTSQADRVSHEQGCSSATPPSWPRSRAPPPSVRSVRMSPPHRLEQQVHGLMPACPMYGCGIWASCLAPLVAPPFPWWWLVDPPPYPRTHPRAPGTQARAPPGPPPRPWLPRAEASAPPLRPRRRPRPSSWATPCPASLSR